ncbi:nitrile hydratase accessory protein [Mesorhizobium sp. ESP-6-4]|uniref:nitrile hydratase accessory protein n=1 Tax=Mesorhizobium sp. ESP-6-4 TaxID=2876624 RepID=UPI001CCE9BC6|nr:nitrile hydratase accessory protein [Mesorhizobium sp. ESP-6-4]MBZ9657990.1 nitrile hydratase accessory protein [Mesorhizobium sp. ESP-6-4]
MSRHEGALPAGFDEPVFAEPWQAEAFALTVALHGNGLFSWSEWAEALSAEVKQPAAASDGQDYYEHWLTALEKLLSRKGVARKSEVDELAAAWERAAHATPHGKPILLENDPGAGR